MKSRKSPSPAFVHIMRMVYLCTVRENQNLIMYENDIIAVFHSPFGAIRTASNALRLMT